MGLSLRSSDRLHFRANLWPMGWIAPPVGGGLTCLFARLLTLIAHSCLPRLQAVQLERLMLHNSRPEVHDLRADPIPAHGNVIGLCCARQPAKLHQRIA